MIEKLAALSERVTILEQRQQTIAVDVTETKAVITNLDGKVDALLGRERMQRGFIAGVVFIISGLWGVFIAAKDRIAEWIK